MIREEKRIKKVYAGYAIKRSLKKKWNAKSPGNLFITERRNSFLKQMISTKLYKPFDQLKVLDIGCGSGDLLSAFFEWGFKAENLYGVDLISQRLDKAKLSKPNFQLTCLNAEKLNFPSQKFDLVVFFTVFSSVLDNTMAINLAQEAKRVLKDKGIIVIYDLRYPNPFNPNTRKLTKKNINSWFGLKMKYCFFSLTLIPILARCFAGISQRFCSCLEKIPFLRSHYLVIIEKR